MPLRWTDARIDDRKVRDYLLSPTHPIGRSKATWFRSLGYTQDDWKRLRDDLLATSAQGLAVVCAPDAHGQKFEVRATLTGPSGRTRQITAVWMVRHDEDHPRFITAYPVTP